jgi:hypothetical protein
MMAATYGYFPGCSLKGTGAAYEESLLTLFRCWICLSRN